ncbi:uncharacterized protein LOC118742712 [Rhagoletis pomonella]|uniref:uncharacterized protein LOC118742712 n=1 Tax=Rhagoletis pomonella TaxID=28610 RepID=UPI0017861EA5|nr:uncharacterized protein LOC118742712 [Rhagoletis pomonella]
MLPRNIKIGYLLIGLVLYCANSEIVAASATECYQCDGEDCDDPAVVQCPDINENEQCYIRLDSNYDFIGMGCSSELGNATRIAELIRNKRIYVCSTSNCNGYENLAQPNDCTECNSTEDARCATQPRLAGRSVRCNNVPYTNCYERVSLANNGTTERGCLFELEGDDFYNCVTGEDALCNLCEDSGCNVEIIPANRTQCQRCDSLTDSNCSRAPSALAICPIYVANDACVSVYESGVTRRGCSSEFSCDATARNCQVCSGTGCNQANVQRRSEELYGIFQDLPLNCNSCSGEDCLVYSQRLRKCEGDIYQDCVTVFNESSVVVARGCETAVAADYESHCAANPELCFNCKSNGCNNITEVKATQQCLYCDEATNADCLANASAITTTRACVEGCVTALYERKSNPQVFDLARTCFEDLEFDDRATCNEANNCVRCTEGDRCNTAAVPADGRLSCLHCDGNDCDEPVSITCSGYSARDQCYIYFDPETHSAVRMGCRSSVSADAIYNDIIHYFLCDGDDCNTYSNLPDANICYVCDSSVDANCAINPTAITAQTRCQINPHTDCFTRINEDGHTIRGCVSTLNNTQFLSCNEGTPGEFCRICSASDCNSNVFPSSRQRCHRCNSTADSTCASEPQAQSVCPIFDEDDYCVSKLVDGVVSRGCATEIQCDANSNSRTCRTCEDNNCNDYEFVDVAIGNPGYFQDLPLNCYHCNGTEECSESLGKIRKCENNNLQTCTTVFNSTSGLVIARGCSDAQEEACADDSNSCYGCKSNGCNLATSEADYIDCIFCDAQEDETCLTNVNGIRRTRKCYTSCITALYNRTDDASPVRELIRTCLDDMDLDDREICAAGNDASCKACSSESCNTDDVGTRISCYQCVDDECQDPQPKTCRAVSENDRCFVQYDETGSIVELGCQSKYDPAEVKQLIVTQRLWVCDGENCNTIDASPSSQACAICSSATDSACAIAPSEVTSATTCAKLPYTQCYSRLLDSGHTERGCLSSIEGEDFYECLLSTNSTKCLACVGANCNKEIYPANRLSCHQCNSTATATCDNTPAASGICLKYSSSEQCVATLDENENTIRGCSSQVSCASGTCQTCQDSDCNTSNLKRKNDGKPGIWQPLPLSCKVCDSQSDCAGNARNLTCSETSDYCMTVFGEQGDVVKRGCSTDVDAELGAYCDANSTQCHNCNSNDCNTAVSLADYIDCIYCDSETNANCVSNTEAVATRRQCNQHCMTALRPRSENSDVYELTRSCLDDKDAEDQVVCQAGSDICVACQGAACNTAKLPVSTPRRSCYICEGEDCIIPDTAECRAFKADDQCFVLFDSESDVKRMGCLSELDDAYVQANIKLLLLCSEGDNCNGFENFPTPTSCVQCDSEDDETCANDPSSAPTVTRCAALPHVECYTRLLSDGTTRRGCANTLSQTVLVNCLSGNSTSCQTCTSDLCNSEVFPADRQQCFTCTSEDEAACESNPTRLRPCPYVTNTETCRTALVGNVTLRGCSSEILCDVNDRNCRSCVGTGCNIIDMIQRAEDDGIHGWWQELPLRCHTCEGEHCLNSLGPAYNCSGNVEQDCATVFTADGEVKRRGCYEDVEDHEQRYCLENPHLCFSCKSNECNDAWNITDYVQCNFCTSETDPLCAINPENAVFAKRSCHKECMVALKDSQLIRTCLDDKEVNQRYVCRANTSGGTECASCDTDNCNNFAFPSDRLRCHVCSDASCSTSTAQYCAEYDQNDFCFAKYENGQPELLGCGSAQNSSDLAAWEAERKLYRCTGNDCNAIASLPTTGGYCLSCNSTLTPACAQNPATLTIAEACPALEDQCVTYLSTGGLTQRGCLSKLSSAEQTSCQAAGTCAICTGDRCNNEIFPSNRRRCHICNSTSDNTCSSAPNSIQICPVYVANDRCVTKRTEFVERGCESELTCDTSDEGNCNICEGDACNTVELYGGALMATASLLTTTIFAIVALVGLRFN